MSLCPLLVACALFVWFGQCPPAEYRPAEQYRPPLRLDTVGEWTPSFYPYPPQQPTLEC